jgi:chromosome segregation ATPase
MIEYALIFTLGACVAGLVWLVLLPAFWRRAVRITTERLERQLPISAEDIFAERDRIRAAHAVEMARKDHEVAHAKAALVTAKGETGERLKAEALLHQTLAAERRRIAALETDTAALKVEIATREARIADLVASRDDALTTIAALEAQRETLTSRLNTTIDLAESRRLALDEARVLGERAREAHLEEAKRSAQLRQELHARQAELRELERRLAGIENSAAIARIKGGEETYQSEIATIGQRRAS